MYPTLTSVLSQGRPRKPCSIFVVLRSALEQVAVLRSFPELVLREHVEPLLTSRLSVKTPPARSRMPRSRLRRSSCRGSITTAVPRRGSEPALIVTARRRVASRRSGASRNRRWRPRSRSARTWCSRRWAGRIPTRRLRRRRSAQKRPLVTEYARQIVVSCLDGERATSGRQSRSYEGWQG